MAKNNDQIFDIIEPSFSSGFYLLHARGGKASDGIFNISKGYSPIGFAVILLNDDATEGNYIEVNVILDVDDAKDLPLKDLKQTISAFVKKKVKKSIPLVIRTKFASLGKWDDEEVIR